jgi:DNA primase
MTNDNTELSELLDALDIEQWLDSQGVDYKPARGRSGRQLNVKVCPVCGNSDSKVYLNAETGLGNCFAGSHPPGQNFTKWRFIAASLGEIPGKQVVEHIRAHVGARGWTAKRTAVAVEKPVQLVLPDSFPLPFQGKNIQYLENRGIDSATAAYFHLRYCHSGFFPYEFEGKTQLQDHSNRVIIPVFDLDGKMVTFQGRDMLGTASKKYLFPPGLPSTGSHLYNGMNVRNTKRIVIGEGAFDVMAIKLALDEEPSLRDVVPVGTFGKHLSGGDSESQEAKFRTLMERGVEDVVIMWDGEIGATDSAVSAAKMLKKLGLKVRVAMLPQDKDPNEVARSVVRDAYYNAVPFNAASAVSLMMQRRKMNGLH